MTKRCIAFLGILAALWLKPCVAQSFSEQVEQGLERLVDLHTTISSDFAVVLTGNRRAFSHRESGEKQESLSETTFFHAVRDGGKDSIIYGMTNSPTAVYSRNLDIWEFRLKRDKKQFYFKGLLNKNMPAIPEDKRPLKERRIFYKDFTPFALPVVQYWGFVAGQAKEDTLLKQCFDYKAIHTEMRNDKLVAELGHSDPAIAKDEMKKVMVFDPEYDFLPVEYSLFDRNENRLAFRTATAWTGEGDEIRPTEIHYFVDDFVDKTEITLDIKLTWLKDVREEFFDPEVLAVVKESNFFEELIRAGSK